MKSYFLMPIKLFFTISSRVMPIVAVGVAEKLFTTPFYSKRRDVEKEILEYAERFSIPMDNRPPLVGYRWGKKQIRLSCLFMVGHQPPLALLIL